MAGFMGAYTRLLKTRPFVGNMVTSAVLFATGDGELTHQLTHHLLRSSMTHRDESWKQTQAIEKRGSNHDLSRTGRIVFWGAGIFAPAVTVWFRTLERLPIQNKTLATAARVGLDQFAFAPCVLTGFFTVMTLLEGKDMSAVKEKWRQSFLPTLQTNWMVWIPAQTINMALIPLHLRLLYVNAINVPWNTFLSIQANKGKPLDPEKALVEKIKHIKHT
ncbi:Protein required for ethanol metabolism [Saitozyma podzolica]|uniref:Protein required for ethanol metabolism n=1 Tax=Saitozyma podzolica TaxID=1890683 RepID=A0A427Y286_9TREE|nr:Protein required for ethanol metabolism [Saitozyma podzolica]